MRTQVIVIALVLSVATYVRAQQRDAAIERARLYEPLIVQAAITHRVDPRLLWTVAYLESRFQPQASSRKGAQGLMQMTPLTAKRYGLRDPFNPEQSIDAAARYLKDLQGVFGDRLDLLLAAYNAGEGAVEAFRNGQRLILSDGKIINQRAIKSPIPPYKETANYVATGAQLFKKLAAAGYFSEPHLAHLRMIDADRPPAVITVDLEEMPEDILEMGRGSVYALALDESSTVSRKSLYVR